VTHLQVIGHTLSVLGLTVRYLYTQPPVQYTSHGVRPLHLSLSPLWPDAEVLPLCKQRDFWRSYPVLQVRHFLQGN